MWLLFTSVTAFVYMVGTYLGLGQLLMKNDHFYTTILTIVIYFSATGYILYSQLKEKAINMGAVDFVSDLLQMVGLIGTIMGMILLFSVFTSDVTATDVNGVKALISKMSSATSIALYTTLGGILNSVFLKIQLALLGSNDE